LTSSFNLAPLEAFPEKIQRVTEERIEFPVNKVEKWYPDTVKLVVEGSVITEVPCLRQELTMFDPFLFTAKEALYSGKKLF
jgi:hypothetical protein